MRRGTCLDDGLLRRDGVEEDARHGGGRAALGGRRGDGVRDGFRKEGERDSSVDAARVRPTHRWRARAVWARGNSRGEGPDAGVHQGCRVARAAHPLLAIFSARSTFSASLRHAQQPSRPSPPSRAHPVCPSAAIAPVPQGSSLPSHVSLAPVPPHIAVRLPLRGLTNEPLGPFAPPTLNNISGDTAAKLTTNLERWRTPGRGARCAPETTNPCSTRAARRPC